MNMRNSHPYPASYKPFLSEKPGLACKKFKFLYKSNAEGGQKWGTLDLSKKQFVISQLTYTYSKSTIETKKGLKYVQS